MAGRRILLIENAASLAVREGRLRIQREGREDSFIQPQDLSVVVLHHPAIRLSVHVLRALAEAGAMLLVTDALHYPCGSLWPWNGQSVLVRRLRDQMALDQTDKQKALWREIVIRKISTQALNLRHFGCNGALRLERMCSGVLPADFGNAEAQAARHYWKHLLSPSWKRVKQGATDPLNARLNYGYAVLRALVARELAAAGLQPGLGLGHCNFENPFNLADDFMEPYRYLVERRVLETGYDAEFDGPARVAVLGFLESEVRLGEKVYRMPVAVSETVASFIRVLEGKATPLALPGIPCKSTVGG